jgi:DNA (cytosine-5)-methyltransferase 1
METTRPLDESPAIEQSDPVDVSRRCVELGHPPLVLSLFPGVDLLGRAFSAAGFCVVAGPDLILDQRIEDFRATPGRFDGVIGGPPCQNYSDANRRRVTAEGDRLVREFLRVVDEARPTWFLMENVRNVPDVRLQGYSVQRLDCSDWEFGGRTGRLRHIQFGHRDGWIIRPARTITDRPVTPVPTLTTAPAGAGDRYSRRCAKMGLTPLALSSFTPAARRRVIGNGVPWGMGCALAEAVRAAGPVTPNDCRCGCGRLVTRAGSHASVACRQRTSRRRRGHFRSVGLFIQDDHPDRHTAAG